MSPKWTHENIQKLLVSLRNNVPADKMSGPYFRTVKAVDWNKVAFPPFSPSACRQKWMWIMYKVSCCFVIHTVIDYLFRYNVFSLTQEEPFPKNII